MIEIDKYIDFYINDDRFIECKIVLKQNNSSSVYNTVLWKNMSLSEKLRDLFMISDNVYTIDDVQSVQLNITKKELLLFELKIKQKELRRVSNQKKNIKLYIQNLTRQIDIEENVLFKAQSEKIDYIQRDVDLVIYLLRNSDGPVSTHEIIVYINKELKDKHTRWDGDLDSNRFMTILGNHVRKDNNVLYTKDVYMGKKRYNWTI